MRILLIFSSVLILFSCGNKGDKQNISADDHEKAKKILLEDEAFDPFLDDEDEEGESKGAKSDTKSADSSEHSSHHEYVANYYVLITDTGLDYFELRSKMFELSKVLNYPIDTLDREYNQSKDLIALPIDDLDPSYAGEYFQRRFPSNNLSLEYVNSYQLNTREKNIGVVAGIYEKEEDALKFLEKIKIHAENGFVVKAQVYIGCIH